MARWLYRLGRFSARRPWIVVVTWVLLLGGAVGAFAAWGGPLSTSITLPDTPTQQTTQRLEGILGAEGEADRAAGSVVIQRVDDEAFSVEQRQQISDLVGTVEALGGVSGVQDPFGIADEVAANRAQLEQAQEQIDQARAQLDEAGQQLDAATTQAQQSGAPDSVRAQLDAQREELGVNAAELDEQEEQVQDGMALLEMSGGAVPVSEDGATVIVQVTLDGDLTEVDTSVTEDVRAAFEKADIDGVTIDFSSTLAEQTEAAPAGELIGVAIAAIVLIVMLGTLIAAGLPLLNALLGVGISILIVLSLSTVTDVHETTPVLATMLGLAVGIDYTLFILHRHRRQLLSGRELEESIALATGTAGTAVVFAGLTVIIALLALNVTGIALIGLMGTAAAIAVAVSVLIAISLTPALLRLTGTRILTRRARRNLSPEPVHHVPDAKPMSNRRAWVGAIASVLVLGIVAVPATQMRLGLPDDGSQPTSSTQYRAFEKIEEAFGAGYNAQLIVVADLPDGLSEDDSVAQQLRIGQQLLDRDDIVSAVPVIADTDHDVIVYQVTPAESASAASTEDLVRDLRAEVQQPGRVTFEVAGSTSASIDVSAALANSMPLYLAVVVGLSFLIMIGVFRSLFVPVVATAGFVLSLAAAMGAVTAVYQFGWLAPLFNVHSTGPVLSLLPTLLIGILFGLAMDYQLFIGSGIREAFVHGRPPRMAVAEGLRSGRAVVTAAALIMASVFAGFIYGGTMVGTVGLGLTIGVLADAFVVRPLLMPALVHLAGRGAWWLPRWLGRLIPNIDIEGASLQAVATRSADAEDAKAATRSAQRVSDEEGRAPDTVAS